TVQKSAGVGTTVVSVSFDNDGITDVDSGILQLNNPFINDGTIDVVAGATFMVNGATFVNTATGIIQGDGTITTPAGLTGLDNFGTINAGTSPGTLTINGNLTLNGTSVINIELGGTNQGVDYDWINVTGDANLDGTLNVSLFGGFTPTDGDTFDPITCGGSCNSTFAAETLPTDFSTSYPGALVQLAFTTCIGDICWDNDSGDGFWSTFTNWNTNALPAPSDYVVIDLGGGSTVTLNSGSYTTDSLFAAENLVFSGGSLTVANGATLNGDVAVSGGTLDLDGVSTINSTTVLSGTGLIDGTGAITMNGAFNWSGGADITGAGLLTTNGITTISGAGVGHGNGVSKPWLNNGTVNLNGLMDFYNSATMFTNAAGAAFNIDSTFAIPIDVYSASGHVFDNAGTINKSGAATATIPNSFAFNNTGTVNVDGGTLQLQGGNPGTDTGAYAIAAPATLTFHDGAYDLSAGAGFSGTGKVLVTGTGQLNVNGPLTTGVTMDLSGPNAAIGGTGALTLTGAFNWDSGADIVGVGILTTQGITTISGSGIGHGNGVGKPWFNEGTVNLDGWMDFFNTPTTITNTAIGTFNLGSTFSTPIDVYSSSGHVFQNDGILNKTAVGAAIQTVHSGIAFNNNGTVDVDNGTLVLANLFTNDGIVDVATGAEFQVNGATFVNAATGIIQGDGTITTPAGLTGLDNFGAINAGTSPGTLTINGNLTLNGTSVINIELGGNNQGVDYDWINVTGDANLDGELNVSLFGVFTPTDGDTFDPLTCGGSCNGTFATETLPANFSTSYPGALVQLAFTTCIGDICWDNENSNGLWFDPINWNTDTLPTPGDNVVIDFMDGSTVLFDTAGSLTIASMFSDEGVDIVNGSLFIAGAADFNAGLFISGGDIDLGVDSRASSLTLSGGNVQGAGQLTVNGAFNWSGGTLGGSGNLFVSTTGALSGADDKVLSGTRTLTNGGVLTWSGTGDIVGGAPNIITNLGTGMFEIHNDQTIAVTVNSAGTLTKSAGGGATTFTSGVTNNGTVNANNGILRFLGGYTQVAGLTRLNGGGIDAAGLNLNGGSLDGKGTVTGNVANNGGMVAAGASPGTLTISGDYTQGAGGSMSAELGGFAQGIDYDLLAITGVANLDGALNVDHWGGFNGSLGDQFDILTYGSVTGDFATINPPAGYDYQADSLATYYRLTVLATPAVGGPTPPSPSPPPPSSPPPLDSAIVSGLQGDGSPPPLDGGDDFDPNALPPTAAGGEGIGDYESWEDPAELLKALDKKELAKELAAVMECR
ncbi:MAG: hypothetical protein GY731_01825, partial [Gammaproteobacteria bacterium]|nr:hypothetical protein [Gammaproteobacteria bacterium]